MDTSPHTLQALFSQLGLECDALNIRAFIEQHRPLPPHVRLVDAPFWTEGQSEFLKQALNEDSDWCILVDQLDCFLREQYSWIDLTGDA